MIDLCVLRASACASGFRTQPPALLRGFASLRETSPEGLIRHGATTGQCAGSRSGLIPASLSDVNKLCIFGGTTVCSDAFWALGDALGFSFFGSFMLSGVGSVVGVYLGWKLAQKLQQ